MRKLILIFLYFLPGFIFGQFHLICSNTNENFAFLKNGASIKVEFNIDSLAIFYGSFQRQGENPEPQPGKKEFYEEITTTFMKFFPKEAGKNFEVSDSSNNFAYTHVLKVSPLRFYGDHISYNPEKNSPAQTYVYFKAEYLFEIFTKADTVNPVRSFRVSNLSNPLPLRKFTTNNHGSFMAYTQKLPLRQGIISSSKKAGIESAKYMAKLIKASK